MSRLLLTIPVLATLCLPLPDLQAQSGNQSGRDFTIESVTGSFESTPKFPGPSGKASRTRTQWMQIEVLFAWQNTARTGSDGEALPVFLDELEIEVYALLNTKASAKEQAALVSGSTTLKHVPQDRNLAAAVYISPRLIDQLFPGRAPTSINAALLSRDALGAVLKYNGEVVATFPVLPAGQTPFWEDLAQVRLSSDVVRKVDDGILPKWKTPFAYSNWDYYQHEKAGD
jgi:hypothetical protein